ncbi:hypothetical protein [Nocardioides sp.]|uniref:hypothetical protein n=1 Tax=Nocardioides sp. TaxID=35761 RepID=UPI0027363DC6|nr:hypothetical protein [Nocardioides sp.]MDP3891990.1 hypothetical protein [Nocardioides sp.]
MTALRVPELDLAYPAAETVVASTAPVECLTLPATDLGHHEVLRSFDLLRRRISIRLRGTEGCFTGYSRLDLDLSAVADDTRARLTCVAALTSATADRQSIRFEAFLEPHDSPLDEPSSQSVRVASGDGLVVAFR